MERLAELAKLKSLLFYQEQKWKRQARIKSKKYRRVHKRDRLRRASEETATLAAVDPEGAKEAQLELERQRIRERMTLKHKNTSKWAKEMLRDGRIRDPSTKRALEEQLRLGEELRKKQRSMHDDAVEDDSAQGDDDADDASLRNGDDGDDGAQSDTNADPLADLPQKGLMGMKFMRRAMERQYHDAMAAVAHEADVDDAASSHSATDASESDARADSHPPIPAAPVRLSGASSQVDAVAMSGGRRARAGDFLTVPVDAHQAAAAVAAASTAAALLVRAPPPPQVFDVDVDWGEQPQHSEHAVGAAQRQHTSAAAAAGDSASPARRRARKRTTKPMAAVDGADDAADDVAASPTTIATSIGVALVRATPVQNGDADERALETDAGAHSADVLPLHVDDAHNPWLSSAAQSQGAREKSTRRAPTTTTAPPAAAAPSASTAAAAILPSASASVSTSAVPLPRAVAAKRAFHLDGAGEQAALVQRAFASVADDAEHEFEAEKAAVAESELPAELQRKRDELQQHALPGWGSWTGEGAPAPRPNPRVVEGQRKLDAAAAEAKQQRRDAKLKHVIITERRDKKAAKFMHDALPHPFTSREQFERVRRMPIGAEWVPSSVHTDMTKPRVVTTPGEIITPMRYSKKEQQALINAKRRQPKNLLPKGAK